jgi:hypothetical protein
MSKPHSQTVRGTLSNPNTPKNNNPPQLGDHVSLQAETRDAAQSSSSKNESHQKGADQINEDLPHSKKVRGTLAHAGGSKVNKSQLGDPTSLDAETSDTKNETGAHGGTASEKEEMQKAADKRAGGSKL